MYSQPVMELLQAVSSGDEVIYSTPAEVEVVTQAVDLGLCRLVPNAGHRALLHETNWDVFVGIEATKKGEAELGQLAA